MGGPWERWQTSIRNMGIRAKLLWMTLFLSGLPLVLLSVFTIQTAHAVLQSALERQDRTILEERRRFIQTVMDEVESLVANVASQDAIREVLNRIPHTMSDYDRLATQAKIGYIMAGYVNLRGLVAIDVIGAGGETFHVGNSLNFSRLHPDWGSRLFEAARASHTSVSWGGIESNGSSPSSLPPVVTAVKLLPGRLEGAGDSLLVVSYDPGIFNWAVDHDTDSYSILLDGQGRVINDPDPRLWGTLAPGEILGPLGRHLSRFVAYLRGREYDVTALGLTKAPWVLVHLSSTKGLRVAQWTIVAGAVGALALAFLMVFLAARLVTRRFIQPILRITEGFQALRNPRAPRPEPFSFDGRDEIGTLVLWYHTFLDDFAEKQRMDDELHLRQAELKELNRTLEARVEAEVLANREKDSMLIQQSRQASMGEMIGNIAHQWRQPLNVVALMVQELQMRYADGRLDSSGMDSFAEEILTVVERMSSTIDDFRDFFKPNKDKVSFSLDASVMTTLSFVDSSFKNHSINLVVDSDSPGTLVGYPNEVSQVLLNILNNAQDVLTTTNPPRKEVRIRLWSVDGHPRVSITDSGGGVPEAILDKIFDPYFTTKGPGKGTGIGLFMSKTIIERNMGGRISVRNVEWEPGMQGAEFTLEF